MLICELVHETGYILNISFETELTSHQTWLVDRIKQEQ